MAGTNFVLPDEQVEVRYIKRQTGIVTNEKHVAYGGMLEGAYITFRPKTQRNGTYANVLTNDEKAYLENILGLPNDGLSVYKRNENYWDNVKIRIGKEGLYLDLKDPEQYIQYKVLLSLDDKICPDINKLEEQPKQTYKYVIVRKNDVAKQVLKKIDINKEAYKLLGKIEDDVEAMKDFLMVNDIYMTDDTTVDIISAEVSKLLADNPEKFVRILKDPSYNTRILLHKALRSGEVVKRGSQYYSKDGEALAEPNQVSTLQNTLEYLESSANQEYKLLLLSKLKKK